MILEIADIRIAPGQQAAFEDAIQRALSTVVSRAKGFLGGEAHRCIENPERYVLTIRWETVENHTVDFRQGPLFSEWRALIGPCFAPGTPPFVEHFTQVGGDGA